MASKPKKKRPAGRRKAGGKRPPPKRRTSSRRKSAPKRTADQNPPKRPIRTLLRWMRRAIVLVVALLLLWITAYAVLNPPTTPYILSEKSRLGDVDRQWIPIEEMSPFLARSVVAAEDANFCTHWGFDMAAIRAALDEGAERGGSTITQQVVKNVFLWHGRSWLRKALEAVITPAVEAIWTKRRIIEVYLNVAEFDEGVFGAEAATRHYFDVGPEAVNAYQSALLASILPDPKNRSASHPGAYLRRRAGQVQDGAATILADGRASCFED